MFPLAWSINTETMRVRVCLSAKVFVVCFLRVLGTRLVQANWYFEGRVAIILFCLTALGVCRRRKRNSQRGGCVSVCLSVCLPLCAYICVCVCLLACVWVCVRASVCLSVCLYVCVLIVGVGVGEVLDLCVCFTERGYNTHTQLCRNGRQSCKSRVHRSACVLV